MNRRIVLLVSLVFALLALLLEGGLALYWNAVLAPRLGLEARQQAQVLAQSQAGPLIAALSEADPRRRHEQVARVIDELLLLRDENREQPFFVGVGLELDYDSVAADPGSLDRALQVDERTAYAIDVDLYQRDSAELLGIAHFGVSKRFYYSFSSDLRRQMVIQAALVAAVLALLWGSLAWLLNRHERQRARFQRELEAARDAAETASRSKSQFLANMSHEIRTPMNAVIGMSTLLGKTQLDRHQQMLQKQLGDSAQLLLGVIDDILDLSRIEAGKLPVQRVEFALDQVWSDLRSVLGSRASDKGLELLYRVASDAPSVLKGDPGRLKQVLVNLISNAIKFTDAGEVCVELSVLERDAQSCLLHFAVSDTGIGMAPELLPRMFDAFTQVDESNARRHGGSGLGLAICKRLVELMGGVLTASSEPGRGSRFEFSVRFAVLAAPSERAMRARGLRALVVDDHPGARDILGSMLESLRFDVTLVDSAELALLRLAQQPFDLLLAESSLPGMGGVALVNELRRRNLPVPAIVLLSPQFSDDMRRQARAARIDVHLLKPVSPSSLLDAAMQALGDAQRITPNAPSPMLPMTAYSPPFAIGCKVLLAEDHAINQQVAIALLSELGLDVEAVGDGHAALAALRRGGFDAVLMDVQMPGMDGVSATRELKADPQLKHLPVIALTAHAMSGDRERFLAAGMDDYLAKPIDETALLRVLSRWLPARPQAIDNPAEIALKPQAQTLPQIPGVDCAAALRRLGGKQTLYWQLLGEFRQRHADAAQELTQLLNGGSPAQLQQAKEAAHAIKGAAATLGADHIADAAGRLEHSASAGVDHVALADLQRAMAALVAASLPAASASAPQPGPSAHNDLQALLTTLERALSCNDLSASSHLLALGQALPTEHQAVHQQLEHSVATLDFGRAREQLVALRSHLASPMQSNHTTTAVAAADSSAAQPASPHSGQEANHGSAS